MRKLMALGLAAVLALGSGCARGNKHFVDGIFMPRRCEEAIFMVVLLPVLVPACILLEAIWDEIFPPEPRAAVPKDSPEPPGPSAGEIPSGDAAPPPCFDDHADPVVLPIS